MKNFLLNGVLFICIPMALEDIPDKITTDQSILFRSAYSFSQSLLIEALQVYTDYPELALAQAKLETGNFTSVNFRKNNNLFGMMHPYSRQTHSLGSAGHYAKYSNWIYSVLDYQLMINYYTDRGRDIEYVLSIYAEDPEYGNKLNQLI